MTEVQNVLGWRLNTRLLKISLPAKKFDVWQEDIAAILKQGKASYKVLESIIGRLSHAAQVCMVMGFLLNRMRSQLRLWEDKGVNKKVRLPLSKAVLLDLELWNSSFLPKVNKGLSMNLITYQWPTLICWSDACPQGMGGYKNSGLAWQFQILDWYREKVAGRNN